MTKPFPPISRTQQKKAVHVRQKLGERLVGLSAEQLERIKKLNHGGISSGREI